MNDYENFLVKLNNQINQEIFAKITSLNFQENPVESIEGVISTGNINIDGNSIIRRSCNLTLISQNLNFNDAYWGVKTKFKLELGLKNNINSSYPEIIWFSQGIYVITSFTTNQATNNYTISIQGKDKMCLLNGDLGGSMPMTVDLGMTADYRKIPIKEILKYSLMTYAQEPYQNIIIKDLDEVAVELLEYKGNKPLYLLRNVDTDVFENYTSYGDIEAILPDGNSCTLDKFEEEWYDTRVQLGSEINNNAIEVKFEDDKNDYTYTIGKLEQGEAAGYRVTELTYAGDLIINAGSSLTSGYDKIVKMLGNYEYFYNVNGQFVFQRKKNYINTIWNNKIDSGDEIYYADAAYLSPIVYSFEDGHMIQSYQNNPNIQNIKNDYVVWGERIGASGAVLPIHYRYAIDKKPKRYKNYDGTRIFTTDEYDWRELIYQMAIDYMNHNNEEDYEEKLKANNEDYANGKTGYEIYYTDIVGFWRELYNPNPKEEEKDQYYAKGEPDQYWNKDVIKRPEILNFWLDFLDTEGDFGQYSVGLIGDRIKVVNDKAVKAIHYKEVPSLIFVTQEEQETIDPAQLGGYNLVQVQSDLEGMFSISSQGKSAKQVLDELIYTHLYNSETITLKAIPVYHLQPNQRIYVKNELSKIDGDYIITKISYGLGHNAMMTITANKAPTRYL